MAEYENNLRIKKETDYNKAMKAETAAKTAGGSIGCSKDNVASAKKTCNARKEIKMYK